MQQPQLQAQAINNTGQAKFGVSSGHNRICIQGLQIFDVWFLNFKISVNEKQFTAPVPQVFIPPEKKRCLPIPRSLEICENNCKIEVCALLPRFWVDFFHEAGQLFQSRIHPSLNKETKVVHTLKSSN